MIGFDTLEMEVAESFKSSVIIYKSTRRNGSKDFECTGSDIINNFKMNFRENWSWDTVRNISDNGSSKCEIYSTWQ